MTRKTRKNKRKSRIENWSLQEPGAIS